MTGQERQPGLADKLAITLDAARLVLVNEIAGTIKDVMTQPDRLAFESLWEYTDRRAGERVAASYARHDEFLAARGLPTTS